MKATANRIFVFAASAVILGTTVWGQSTATTVMDAKIPFAFHTSRGTLPAGEYRVVDGYNGIAGVLALQSKATSKWVVAGIGSQADSKGAAKTSIVFRCDDGCALTAIKTLNHVVSYTGKQTPRGREVAIVATPHNGTNAE